MLVESLKTDLAPIRRTPAGPTTSSSTRLVFALPSPVAITSVARNSPKGCATDVMAAGEGEANACVLPLSRSRASLPYRQTHSRTPRAMSEWS